MPLYDYECECGYTFDDFKLVNERHYSPCPKCGKLAGKLITTAIGTMIDSTLKDVKGQPIWFPKNGKPYFDPALQKTFTSKQEKASYMRENKIAMDGSEGKKLPVEAGDMRKSDFRKQFNLD